MAHEVETMAYAGEVPWHGLGVKVIDDLTPAQMLDKAGLDWTVNKVPTYIDFNGQKIPTEDSALVRSTDGKILSVVSGDWHPVQNHEAFEFFNDFVMAGNMKMHTAGSLREGKNVWALAKINDDFEILGGDKVESYLLFSNPHEYGKSVDVRLTPIRVVCNNTLTLALGSTSDLVVRLSHRRAFDADMVKTTLGVAHNKMSTYKEAAEFLSTKRYTDETLHNYLRELFPSLSKENKEVMSRPAETILSVVDTQPGAEFAPGSWWNAFNAVTYATDHVLGHTNESRMQSSWYGQNRQRKVTALNKAISYAEAA
jgi:phage/plasmid-like protein (TIGR03299 family)